MRSFGISEKDAPYFLPPYEWYNRKVSQWTEEMRLTLINFSPGTRSAADYTYPELGASYRSTEEIYKSIIDKATTDSNGLNGFILLLHIGTDARRTDKFYFRLEELIRELKSQGYEFVSLKELLN